MAYPTTLVFQPSQAGEIGQQPNSLTDTVKRHPLGKRCKFIDPVYGEIECIYLAGVAACVAGSLVIYDPKNFNTVLTVAASRGPAAVAMSAVVAGQFGWFAVQGLVPASTAAAGTGAANSGIQTSATAGQATVSGTAGQKISGARCTAAQDGPGVGFTDVELAFPCANGDT